MLIITLGDPFSINVEGLLAIFAKFSGDIRKKRALIIGCYRQFERQRESLGFAQIEGLQVIEQTQDMGKDAGIYFLDLKGPNKPANEMLDEERGDLAKRALFAVRDLKLASGEKLGVLTLPINKFVTKAAGFPFPGQTEFFESIWGGESIMILAGPLLRVGLVTNHLPITRVRGALSPALLKRKAKTFRAAIAQAFSLSAPQIAITALNPHAGDSGAIGSEEKTWIQNTIGELGEGFQGPFPADTIFSLIASGRANFDGVLAMYHDQGLGPLKALHPFDAINITGGLEHWRSSPDHGPAEDHYLKKTSDLTSFLESARFLLGHL